MIETKYSFFSKIKKSGIKRNLIQLCFFIIQNPFLSNFFSGKPYNGPTKTFCAPGLHCYSCPSMAFGCPLGTLQYVIKYAAMIPFFALGTLTAAGALFGRATCAYVCPFGFFQEILYSISPWKKIESNLPRKFRLIKWFNLFFFVLLIPAFGLAQGFCAYICPSGLIFAGIPIIAANSGLRASIGLTFWWKTNLTIFFVAYFMREKRAFCRYICPLGLILGFFNRISLFQIKLNQKKCVSCNLCKKSCPMGIDPAKEVNSIECIKCGDCVKVCRITKRHLSE